ncbi:hypothetical protein [Thermodesulforhabdus norvegica]|uniref:Uncharacterized protein n=1 Tax=Thermodesulforhabdus norvegica TaxID=39841 RepID=A0A1I4UQJ5_9BACT|nr:hypothetical protein [Thermodesulforhabdus norvegica]SFM91277.1 hypothetical protein SAMN05660836_01942 [Thermodesulforhabdus norvegica]
MPMHYSDNLTAVTFAGVNLSLSRRRSTSAPEWALPWFVLLASLGLIARLRFGLSSLIRTVRKVHGHPLFAGVLFGLLAVGHQLLD